MGNTNPTTSSINLGQISAIYTGTTAPTNNQLIWGDTSDTDIVFKTYSSTLEEWVEMGSSGGSFTPSINLGNSIFVTKNGNDTTGQVGNLFMPFNTIGGAIAKAKTLSPNPGARVSIIVYSGFYDESAILDQNYIDIYAYSPKGQLYSEIYTSGNTPISFNNIKRDIVLTSLNLAATALNNYIVGIDIKTISLNPFTGTQSSRFFKNIVAQAIVTPNIDTTGQINHANFYDVISESAYSVSANGVLSGNFYYCIFNVLITGSTGTLTNLANNIYMQNVHTTSGAMGFSSSRIFNNSTFINCDFFSGNFNNVQNCTFTKTKFGDNCIISSTNNTFSGCLFGNNCLKDFTTTNISDCVSNNSIGVGGSIAYLSGNLDNVTSDYSNGFANGRKFLGNLRRMVIRATNLSNPALNIKYVNGQVPSNIEYSTILHCASNGITITGDQMFLTYCKLNSAYNNINALGSPESTFNVIHPSLCNFIPGLICDPASQLSITHITSTDPAIFTLQATMPLARVGTQCEITSPTGAVTVQIVEVGNSDGAALINFNVTIASPSPVGIYSFRVRTVCQFDESLNVISASQYFGPVNGVYNNASPRVTAWRGEDPHCQLVYATYSVIDFDATTGTHKIQRSWDDGTTGFSYYIYCSATTQSVGPYVVTFAPGQLTSASQTGIAASCFTSLSIQPNSYQGTRTLSNNGFVAYSTLQQYYTDDSSPTGVTKPNTIGDANYIAPTLDTTTCPVPTS